MKEDAEHEQHDWAANLATAAVAVGILSLALSIAYGQLDGVIKAFIGETAGRVFDSCAGPAALVAICTALLAVGLSVAAQVVRWRGRSPSGSGCLPWVIAVLALGFSLVFV